MCSHLVGYWIVWGADVVGVFVRVCVPVLVRVCVHVCCACCTCACMRACAYLCERPRVVCPWMVALAGGGALGFPVGDMSAIEEAEGEEGEDEADESDLAAFDAMRLGEGAGEQLHRPRQGPWGWGCRAAPCVALIVAWGAGGCRVEGSHVPRGVCQGCCCPALIVLSYDVLACVCPLTIPCCPPPVPWGCACVGADPVPNRRASQAFHPGRLSRILVEPPTPPAAQAGAVGGGIAAYSGAGRSSLPGEGWHQCCWACLVESHWWLCRFAQAVSSVWYQWLFAARALGRTACVCLCVCCVCVVHVCAACAVCAACVLCVLCVCYVYLLFFSSV